MKLQGRVESQQDLVRCVSTIADVWPRVIYSPKYIAGLGTAVHMAEVILPKSSVMEPGCARVVLCSLAPSWAASLELPATIFAKSVVNPLS